jgi:23S rRNA (guanosine2251-2'-O)-methyltransferase
LLVTPQRRQALEKIVLHATTLRIPIVEVEGGSLTALAGFDGHQGVAVVVEARRFAGLEDILARSIERAEPAFVLVLDSLEDPQNVGTLLRSAEAAGVHGVVFPTERQAPLSPAAVKASAGATEHLLLAPVDDLPATLTDLHLRGVRIVGSDGDAPLAAREADLRGPVALVVGSEGHGLSPAVRRRCDLFVRLPMRGAVGSLNAAVAGSVLLFEILGQREAASSTSAVAGAPGASRGAATGRGSGTETAAKASPKPPAKTAPTASAKPSTAGRARGKANATIPDAPPDRPPEAPGEARAQAPGGPDPEPPPRKRTRASFGKVAPAAAVPVDAASLPEIAVPSDAAPPGEAPSATAPDPQAAADPEPETAPNAAADDGPALLPE